MRANRTLILLMCATALAAGCAPKPPAVFDKPGMDGIHSLVVTPLTSSDPSVGPIISGDVVAKLLSPAVKDLAVMQSPVLWRLAGDAPRAKGLSDADALALARAMGADAVLIGRVGYAVELVKAKNMPAGLEKNMEATEFMRDFSSHKGEVSVNLRILSVQAGRAVYEHSAQAKGAGESGLLAKAAEDALKPFEQYVRSSR